MLIFLPFLIQCSLPQSGGFNENGVSIARQKAQALTAIGHNFANKKLYTQAIENYMKAIDADPKFSEPHYAMGRTLLKRGFTNRGIQSIKKAIFFDNNLTEAKNFLAKFYFEQGKYPESLKYSISAAKDIVYFDQEASLTQLGLTYDKLGRKSEALLNMKRALSTQVRSCKNRFNISKFFYNRGFVDTSLRAARQADQICSSKEEKNAVLFLKALIFYKSNNLLASQKILKSIKTEQNTLRKSIPKLLSKINNKTGI